MNGTDRNAPPAPTMLDTSPMPLPTANNPAAPGSARVGAGLRSMSTCVAAIAMNVPKNAARNAVDMMPTACEPASAPTIMPGAMPATTRQTTAPCR